MAVQRSIEVQVWDPFVRAAHWTIAIGFFVSYLTEDEAMTVHVWAGYVVGALVLLRLLWGFIGPRHARFDDFIYVPRAVLSYLLDLISARGTRYVGHSPAGGAMVIALLLFLALTVATGLILYAEEGAGPLAPLFAQSTTASQLGEGEAFERNQGEEEGRERRGRGGSFEEVHEVIANVTLGLVIFHILGVILASFVHHENLAGAMITGRKRRE